MASTGILRASMRALPGSSGQRVSLAIVVQLQAMFEVAQELVGGGEPRIFGAGEKAFIAQAEERDHGAAVAYPRLAAAVQALQALHQELDIADAAGRELDIEAAGGDRALGRQSFR